MDMNLGDHHCPALVRGVRLQPDPQTGQPMLFFPEGVIHLSETAQDILLRCDGRISLAALISELAQTYEVDPSTLRQDVRECLLRLAEQHLVSW
jgi:coenzyme PQQ biosynthesis protein PqqD